MERFGVIEGFYGTPWRETDRLDVLSFCAARGMNAYVYAPKDDPKHRASWRDPYSPQELRGFARLSDHCRALGMTFGFALSPGLDIDYDSASDRRALVAKLAAAVDLGAEWVVVAFDDLPGRTALGAWQGELVAWASGQLRDRADAFRLSVVPTEYAGNASSPYLKDLDRALPPDVDVAWTGPWVVSPTISADDAKARADAVGGRPPLLWDNYPVNDGPMARSLFLGPYVGRDPAVLSACSGVLCNPMPLAHASKVALATAARFARTGAGYQPDQAWAAALADVGGDCADVLTTLAHACADSALAPARSVEAHRLLDRFESGSASTADLAELLVPAREAAGTVADCHEPLWDEVRPWLAQLEVEARAGLAALRMLVALDLRDADQIADSAHGLQAAWDRARGKAPVNVFGARFACYPVVTWRHDGDQVLDLQASVVEDGSAIDRLCRIALAAYATRAV